MNVVVCYKWIPDEADIRVDRSTQEMNLSGCKWQISLYDKNAIEAAVQTFEEHGGNCIALTAGGPNIEKSRKDVLSRGASEGCLVADPTLENADSHVTAIVLAASIKKLGDIDLIVCGEGSGDKYAQQVGPRLARKLQLPVITYVTEFKIHDAVITANRIVEEGVEVVECPLPVVISVLGDSNEPRIPKMQAILGAGKKPCQILSASDIGITPDQTDSLIRSIRTMGNIPDRKKIFLTGEPKVSADEAVRLLMAEGVI